MGVSNNGAVLNINLNGGGLTQLFTVAAGCTLTLDNMELQNGWGRGGGGIQSQGSLILNNDVFQSDVSPAGGGGAVRITGAANQPQPFLIATGCQFLNNQETDGPTAEGGGAIFASGANVSLTGCTFATNQALTAANRNGGAVSVLAGGDDDAQVSVQVFNCQFNGNSAGSNGGAVSVIGTGAAANLSVNNSSFVSNSAGQSGGAVFADGFSVAESNNRFYFNVAATFGGAVYYDCSSGKAFDSGLDGFQNNSAGAGGAVSIFDGRANPVSVTGDWFVGNVADERGGAINVYITERSGNSVVSIASSSFVGNKARGYSEVANDSNGGGAVSITQDTTQTGSAATNIANCTFYNNDATQDGGAILVRTSPLGTGDNYVSLTSLTLTQNGASGSGGGLAVFKTIAAAPIEVLVHNSIIAGNWAPTAAQGPDVFGTVNSQGFNLVGVTGGSSGWQIGGAEPDLTPQTVLGTDGPLNPGLDPNGPTSNGGATATIRLMPGSPALGGGDPALATQGAIDQRGFVRQNAVSIGAYDPNAVNNPPVIGLNSSNNAPVFGQMVTLTATVSASSPQTGTPSGLVEFWDGTNMLGTSLLNSSGEATFATSALAAGGHTDITAIYDGDENFSSATSSDVDISVAQATPVLTVSGTNALYNGSADPATALITGVNGVPGSTLEGVSPTLTYFAGSPAYGTALPGAPSAAGTYTVFASFPGSADYTSTSVNATISETALPSGLGYPSNMIAGPDGNLWFTNYSTSNWQTSIGVMTPGGGVSEFSLPSGVSSVSSLVAGPDGNVWFIEYTSAGTYQIGKVTPSGQFFSYALPAGDTWASYLVAGPGGNLWFIDGTSSGVGHIGQITPSGSVTDFALAAGDSNPWDLIAGPDGDLWYNVSTSSGTQQIVQMTPSGNVTPYSVPAGSLGSLLTGSNGNIWFTAYTPTWQTTIGTITSSGVSVFNLPARDQYASNLTAGPNGNVWFSDSTTSGHSQIAEITPSGQVTDYPLAGSSSYVGAIVAGPDGNVWFSDPRTATARQPEIQMAA